MGKIHIDDALIRHLADLLDETGLSEIEVGTGRDRLRVSRAAALSVPTQIAANISNKGVTNTNEPENELQNQPDRKDLGNEKIDVLKKELMKEKENFDDLQARFADLRLRFLQLQN